MTITLIALGTIAAAIAAVTFIGPLRRGLVTRHLLEQFRRVMPAMSRTEQEALEAGGTWWDAELFSGRPEWSRLRNLPPARLSPAEQAFLDGPVEQLCRMLDDWRITHEDMDLPPEVWSFIRRERLFGLVIPTRYGGLGFSPPAHSEIVMKLASRSITAAVTVMVPNSLGPAELLLRYGTQAQRDRWLPRLASGDEIPCFALTGPKAGSDAASTPDIGVACQGVFKGRPTLGIRIDFDKRYITLGPVATLIGLAFRLTDPDRLLGDDPQPGLTLALIPADTPGIERGRRHLPLGIPFQNGPLVGRGVFIPVDWVIGGQDGIGKGWRMLMESLSEGRGISLPALSAGGGKLATRYTGAYARIRTQFGRPIGDFEGVEAALARIAGRTYQMEAARRVFLAALQAGEHPAVLSAVLKYQLTEGFRQVINDAMDVQGGSGICLGPANPLGRVYQAIPIAITVEGANILTRNLIVFGQGALRCHPHVLEEFRAAGDPDPVRALERFDAAIAGHVGFLIRNLLRTLRDGLSGGRLAARPVEGWPGRHYQCLDWLSSVFALNADLAMMTLGGSLKRRERLSARLGDILSLLFMASCTLKHYEDQGRPDADRDLVEWAMADHLVRIQEALLALWRNFPRRGLARLLRVISFPTGLPFEGPSDALDHRVARLIMEPGAARDRLTAGIFESRDPRLAVGRIELALAAATHADEVQGVLRAAVRQGGLADHDTATRLREAVAARLITAEDAAAVREAEQLRDAVIGVDSFVELRPRQLRIQDESRAAA
ncbi:acyl-CoA dehydrogenase [Thiocapsa roseopersicina]|uniref:Acyl-coenzyme A dehydrogenase n=1 Tax=Thiocapsa roseopersicina TaxID=1058 RepID=A0A1H2QWZ7_THIRO|nr:acyl-CoA dehydrogenase [Thiocapsa roseopersicina]SDW11144.1 acyl-CoA dehydrogenase [Thiocapsa roseopersicina]